MADPVDVADAGSRRNRGVIEARAEPRHAAFGTSIQLGWWDGPKFRTAAGLLKDISRCGAAALAEAAPPKGTSVMMRLDGTLQSEWVGASVVEVTKNRWFRRVPRLVRMQFHEPCPYHVFQAALDVLIRDCRAQAEEASARGAHP